eukprot:192305_1
MTDSNSQLTYFVIEGYGRKTDGKLPPKSIVHLIACFCNKEINTNVITMKIKLNNMIQCIFCLPYESWLSIGCKIASKFNLNPSTQMLMELKYHGQCISFPHQLTKFSCRETDAFEATVSNVFDELNKTLGKYCKLQGMTKSCNIHDQFANCSATNYIKFKNNRMNPQINLIKQETIIQISNKYATSTCLLDFENPNSDEITTLRFELNIHPNTFISCFEANIDNILYIGQIKPSGIDIQSAIKSTNIDDCQEKIISISQNYNYQHILNVVEIKADVLNKHKISFKIVIEQYVQKELNLCSLTVQMLNGFENPFTVNITDMDMIYDVKINSDDVKCFDNGECKSYKIAGEIHNDSAMNEFTVEYKTTIPKTEFESNNNSYILYDNNSKTFCHILNAAHIINSVNDNSCNILIPRRVMFVIDISKSMEGSKWTKTSESVVNSIELLRRNIDRFGVIVFNDYSQLLQECVLATDTTCNYAVDKLQNIHVYRETNINGALLKTIEIMCADMNNIRNESFMNQVILFTDGNVNIGEIITEKILINVATAKENCHENIAIFTFGIGTKENDIHSESFLNKLAIQNDGFYGRIEQNMDEYLKIISNPILLNMNIEYKNDNIYNVTRTKYPAFYSGCELVVCGKIKNKLDNSLQVTLFGKTGVMKNKNCVSFLDICTEMKVGVKTIENDTDKICSYFKLQHFLRLNDMNHENEYEPFTPLAYTNIVEKPKIESNDDGIRKPNINRITAALNNNALKDKYANLDNDMDLAVVFQEFLDEQEYSDSDMEHEFGDECKDDCSFNDWLKEEKGVEDSIVYNIWTDLNLAFKSAYEESDILLKTKYDRINYNILMYSQLYFSGPSHVNVIPHNFNIVVSDYKLQWIDLELEKQCSVLRINPGHSSRHSKKQRELDKATYSLLQIGKQNDNIPMLMWLVDSFNRFRIQRRKRYKQRYTDTFVYKHKFSDINCSRFINDKCIGFRKWLSEYPNEQTHFKDICQASIKLFNRSLLWSPPLHAGADTYLIDDNIIQIGFYILECYNFMETFASQKNGPLPAQIDIVFIVNNFEYISWDDNDSDDSDEKNREMHLVIGNIEERLKSQKHKVNPQLIECKNANQTMLTSVNTLIRNRSNNRVVLIIDRRNDNSKDILYGYQPNEEMKCHKFESDMKKLFVEGLIQNSRICVLPKTDNEDIDIGINHNVNPQCFTLSFHCFGINQISVYLYKNGWGTRFFIEDLKYFLPSFFVVKQIQLFRNALEQGFNRDFAKQYEETKSKCKDIRFERFYKALIDGKPPY